MEIRPRRGVVLPAEQGTVARMGWGLPLGPACSLRPPGLLARANASRACSPTAQAWGQGKPPAPDRLTRRSHDLTRSSHLPSPRKWERGGEAGVRAVRSSLFPSPPAPSPTAQAWGERRPFAPRGFTLHSHDLTRSSLLPSPRKWERGGEAGVRAVRRPRVRATSSPLPLTPLPPLPPRKLGEKGSLRRPSSLHNQLQPHTLLPPPLSP